MPIGAVPDIRWHAFSAIAGRRVWSAAIAQLVEHVIRNDGVTGSSPVCGTSFLSPPVSIFLFLVVPMRGLVTAAAHARIG